jgi:hypothetical protein
MSDGSADVAEGAERAELRALLRSAVRGLGASEQDLIQLQLQQELDVAEIAAMLGVTRNHAHALLSRARAQLEISLGALLVARSGRGDCEALGALLEDWDGQLNVLMRKRINRHIERCPACTERKRRELAPALLLGLAPVPIALMPPGLRTQVLRLVSSDTPDAVAHRASVAQRADVSGPGGFPKPLDPPESAWWQARAVQGAGAAAVAVAAAVLTILALTGAFGTHHGRLSALSHGTPPAGTAPAGTAPAGGTGGTGGTGGSGTSGSPGSSARATASAAARVSPSPSAGATTPAGGGPAPSPSPSARPSSHRPSPSRTPSPRHSPSPSRSPSPPASSTTAPPPPPPPGTLSVSPRTIVLSALSGASIRLIASGGPVSWSITESSGLIGKLSVSPASGRLLAGQSTTVSVNVADGLLGLANRAAGTGGGVCVGCTLTVNPGGIVVSVVIEIDVSPGSPPPSPGQPAVRLVN